jgi:two-component system NtrC family sensor kinase
MKHLFYLLFLILGTSEIVAQDTIRVSSGDLERLDIQIKKHSKTDTNRVKLLTEYANLCFYDLDFLNGFKAISEARTISKDLNFIKGEGLCMKSISAFRRRISESNAFIKSSEYSRMNAGYDFFHKLDIFYEVTGNGILGQYTDLDIFGNIIMPNGARDLEIETIKLNLEKALAFYTDKDNLVYKAYLHEALSFIYSKSDSEKSLSHKKVAQNMYRELKLSYHQLLILVNDINDLLEQGKESEAKPREIEAINIFSSEPNKIIKAHCAFLLSRTYGLHNRSNLQLEYLFQAEELLTEIQEKDLLKSIYLSAASVYEWYFYNHEKALEYEYKELNLRKEIEYYESISYTYLLISESLFGLKKIEDFPEEYKNSLKAGAIKNSLFYDAEVLWIKARMLEAQGKSKEAQMTSKQCIAAYMKYNDRNGSSWGALDLAKSYNKVGDIKNAIKYAQMSIKWATEVKLISVQILASDLLSQLYEQTGQKEKAFFYLKQFKSFTDENERFNSDAQRSELEMQGILKKRQREIAVLETERQLKEQENKTQQVWLISIAGALVSLLLLSFVLVRNNRQKQKTNKVLETTLANLKFTQAQLIQSEKMASLGELTAGIAHEIQNPLNFVNNFSEVSEELVKEIKDERLKTKDERDEALEDEILTDIEQNLQKINHHGNRASSIVKGMLEHSRTSSGKKELTDINVLADEYLRLSYHGLRAKDKDFNAEMVTNFEKDLPKLAVNPQDIGRVLLNLINNAFQAVHESSNRIDSKAYKPTVTVSTATGNGQIAISIKDNGPGIPEEIKDKIFQPFFTTKDTGKGTGLGLSLAYDIVKANDGELKVKSESGRGSEFIVQPPIS